jgi:hypothetical protein
MVMAGLSRSEEGMTAGRKPAELEAMVTERLRDNPACAALARLVIVPEGSGGGWSVQAQPRMGMTISDQCTRAIAAVVADLRRAHYLVDSV